MNNEIKCVPIDCQDPRDCGKKECQREMVVLLKSSLAKEYISEIDKMRNNYSFSRFLFDALRYTISLVIGVTWLAGFVIAKGFWSTFFCIIPFYSWYLIVEAYLAKYGL